MTEDTQQPTTTYDPHLFLNADFTHARELKAWIVDYLGKTIEDVMEVEAHTDVLELPPDGAWKRHKIGDFLHFRLTFADGQHAYRTFRSSVSRAMEILHGK